MQTLEIVRLCPVPEFVLAYAPASGGKNALTWQPYPLAPEEPPEAVTAIVASHGARGVFTAGTMTEETTQQAVDRPLLARVARGEQTAFAALYDRLSGPLYAMCLRMTGDPAEAEDILQEAFLIIWRRAETYDPSLGNVFTWAAHLTRCKTIDHLRARGRRLRVLGPSPLENAEDLPKPAAADTPSASDDAERHEDAARVRRVLRELPAEQSQVIEMAFFNDLSHHEISARLAQPLGTIKARIRRGLLKLRDGLKGEVR